jgi:hypothetical protein
MSGGGAHGHMCIITAQLEYTVIIGTPWAEPYDPGTIPLITTFTDPINPCQYGSGPQTHHLGSLQQYVDLSSGRLTPVVCTLLSPQDLSSS